MPNPQIDQFADSIFSKILPLLILSGALTVFGPSLRKWLRGGPRSGQASQHKFSFADDLVLMPWWVSVILAIAAYIILPQVLPAPFVKGGLVGITTIFLFALAAISALRSWKNRQMLEAQTGIDSLRELPPKRFEDLLGEAYRRQGYKVEETLSGGADGGVDLVLRKNGHLILVQCKRWKGSPVPVEIVRELYGVMHHRAASAAKLVATTRFTSEAIAFAEGKPIELVDSDALLELLRGVQTSGNIPASSAERHVTLDPACPQCGSEMVKRTARRGANAGSQFWGCPNYPKCHGTRDV